MGLHLPNIPTIRTPIPDTNRVEHWRGDRRSQWVAYGPTTTGAIAIGTMAMCPSTTTTTSIRITTRTSTKPVLVRATAGSTTRNTAETRLTPTNKQRISTAARQLAVLENRVVPAVRVASGVLENRAVWVASAVPENPVVPAVQVELAVLESPA